MTTHPEVAAVLAEIDLIDYEISPGQMKGYTRRIRAALASSAEPVATAAWEVCAFGTVQVIVRREDVAAEHLAQYQVRDPKAECHELVRRAHAPPAVPVESLGRDAEPLGSDDGKRDPSVFEQWYVENAPDYESNLIGSRQCWLMRKAWNAACYAHASKLAPPPASVPDVTEGMINNALAVWKKNIREPMHFRMRAAIAAALHTPPTNQEGAAP